MACIIGKQKSSVLVFCILFIIMTQAQLDMSLVTDCLHCENLLENTLNWLNVGNSTFNMYKQLKEEVELYEDVSLCAHCQRIITRKINLLKRIDPSLENVFNAIKYNHQNIKPE